MPYYMYVSMGGLPVAPKDKQYYVGEDRILIFTVDPETGRLESQGDVVVTGGPAPLAIDPGRRFLYVGRRGARVISSYRIDWSTGRLSLISTASLEADPCYITTDRKGRFLLSSYYNAGKVAVHSIGDDGTMGTIPVEWLDTARGAHSIQTDPSNRFAFVPHIAARNGPNMILQFNFNEATGHLTPNSPHSVIPEEGAGPRHFCFHPSLDVLYFCNEQGSSVTAYRFDSSLGTLIAFQMVSTLPDDYEGRNTCAQIQILPSGRFLYAPNRGHNSIACFSVDAYTGWLTPNGRVPTEAIPRAFSLDPEGNFLFAAGLESGRLASYRVNGDTGELEPLETYAIGRAAMWVLITRPAG
ncbi:lactonase family protein [Chloroflexota bacterium]